MTSLGGGGQQAFFIDIIIDYSERKRQQLVVHGIRFLRYNSSVITAKFGTLLLQLDKVPSYEKYQLFSAVLFAKTTEK